MDTLDQLCEIMRDLFLSDFANHEPQQFTIELNPVPASRPRVFGNGGVTFGDRYKEFKMKALTLCKYFTGRKTAKPVACYIEHIVQPPKQLAKPYPHGDIDNYDKGPLDAMVQSKLFFEDDVQAVFLTSVKRYCKAGETPHIHVMWFDFNM